MGAGGLRGWLTRETREQCAALWGVGEGGRALPAPAKSGQAERWVQGSVSL